MGLITVSHGILDKNVEESSVVPLFTYLMQPLIFLEALCIQLNKSRTMMYEQKISTSEKRFPRLIIYIKSKKKILKKQEKNELHQRYESLNITEW